MLKRINSTLKNTVKLTKEKRTLFSKENRHWKLSVLKRKLSVMKRKLSVLKRKPNYTFYILYKRKNSVFARITSCETKQQKIQDDLSKMNTDTGSKIQVIVILLHFHLIVRSLQDCMNIQYLKRETPSMKEEEIDVNIIHL